ncbi:MAG: zf-HC2 domain-containing protein [Myxococcota bacterium]
MNDSHRDLLSRDGHLTGLTLDRYEFGELSAEQARYVEEHLDDCFICRRRWDMAREHQPVIEPPSFVQPSTGSATLAGLMLSGGVAVAATAVLALASTLWSGPQRVDPRPEGPPSAVASAYTTSPPPEYGTVDGSESLDLALRTRGIDLRISAQGQGTMAVVLLAGFDPDGMDTDGGEPDEIVEVLRAPVSVNATRQLTVTPGAESGRVVAVMCREPFAVAMGDTLELADDCVQREILASSLTPRERDS